MNRKKNKIPAVVGVSALVLLAAVLALSLWISRRQTSTPDTESGGTVRLEFGNETVYYDGSGTLDLMEDVRAVDKDGRDVTDQVNAVISPEDNLTEKKIRYSVFDADGKETVGYRKLVLEHYTGPDIETADVLELDAEELSDPAVYLSESGQMTVQDGFGKEVSDQTTWIREKTAPGTYEFTFTYVNRFGDSAESTAPVLVRGETEDLTLTLSEDEVILPAGAEFHPEDYLKISDPTGSAYSVQVTGEVDTEKEGRYSVHFTVLSSDRTQKARALLKVQVTDKRAAQGDILP